MDKLKQLHIKNFKNWIYRNKIHAIYVNNTYFVNVVYIGKGNIIGYETKLNNNGIIKYIEHVFKIADIIKTDFTFITK